MQFEDSFFEDEVRDGFYVPSMIKRAWAAELEVLSEVDRICRKYDITYFADWGTLLATVRHQGFIPWDDDLDIAMKRADYDRFMQVAERELPKEFRAYNYKNHEDFWLFLARVVGKQRICFEEDHLKRFHEFPYISGVDIFVLDYVSSDPDKEERRCSIAKYMIKAADEIAAGNLSGKEAEDALKKIEGLLGIRIERPASGQKADMDAFRRRMYGEIEKLFAMFGEDEATELTQLFPFGLHNKKFRFPKEYYSRSARLPYENTTISVPIAYNEVLRKRYGDYMKLVRNAGGHDYPFFAAQQTQLEAVLGEELPRYRFSMSDLQRDEETDRGQKARSFKVMAQECCNELERLNRRLSDMLEGIPEDTQAVCTEEAGFSLQESQQFAIDFGTLIEQAKGEGFVTVKILEQYCEALFGIYELLLKGDRRNYTAAAEKLSRTIEAIADSVKQDIIERKEVVFLPYKASAWKGLESVWKAASEDPKCDVYVIPIPYYYKNYAGEFQSMKYEADQFPLEVSVTKYDEFDFAFHHPDIIFFQNPFDECDPVTSVHTFFYSGNLRKYSDQLVYIPYFTVEEFSRESYREYYNMRYYCTVPGVVRADKVIVQSENMRKMYIEKLTEFAGADTRKIWEDKILGNESPLRDGTETQNAKADMLPEAWKRLIRTRDGGRKKMVVYGLSASCIAEHGDIVLQKIGKVLETFRAEKDRVTLIFRPHPQMEEFTKPVCAVLWEQYQKLVDEYRRDGWGIYDGETDIDLLAAIADAYYGDGGRLAMAFQMAGKPVMLANVE